MKFSRRTLIRAAVLVGLVLGSFIVIWPLMVMLVWLNSIVLWAWPAVIALILVVMASIVEEATGEDRG